MGACLDNQLHHLKQRDAERVSAGLQPQYLVSRYLRGGESSLRVNGSAERNLDRVRLELPVDQISTSLVTLEVAADSLRFVENSSPGEVRCPPRPPPHPTTACLIVGRLLCCTPSAP